MCATCKWLWILLSIANFFVDWLLSDNKKHFGKKIVSPPASIRHSKQYASCVCVCVCTCKFDFYERVIYQTKSWNHYSILNAVTIQITSICCCCLCNSWEQQSDTLHMIWQKKKNTYTHKHAHHAQEKNWKAKTEQKLDSWAWDIQDKAHFTSDRQRQRRRRQTEHFRQVLFFFVKVLFWLPLTILVLWSPL